MRNANINRVLKTPTCSTTPMRPSNAQRVPDHVDEALVVEPVFDAVVEAAYEALPEMFHDVVELVDVNGLSYAEARSCSTSGGPASPDRARNASTLTNAEVDADTPSYRPESGGE